MNEIAMKNTNSRLMLAVLNSGKHSRNALSIILWDIDDYSLNLVKEINNNAIKHVQVEIESDFLTHIIPTMFGPIVV